jgi:hypothetical protein
LSARNPLACGGVSVSKATGGGLFNFRLSTFSVELSLDIGRFCDGAQYCPANDSDWVERTMRLTFLVTVVVVVMAVAGVAFAVDETPAASVAAQSATSGGAASPKLPAAETWGFEPDEGFVPGPIGGQSGSVSWTGTAEPHIETANPHQGAQHFRISWDPDVSTPGLTGAWNPTLLDTVPDNTQVSMWVRIGDIGGAEYVVVLSSVTQQRTTAQIWFESDGDIQVVDRLPGTGLTWVDTGSDWIPGSYVQLEIRVDPVDDQIEYMYGASLVYSSSVVDGTVIERVWLTSDNAQNGEHADFDDLVVEHGKVGPVVHRWSFTADGSDSVGGAHAVLHNGAHVDGGALVFDGVDDYAELPISGTLRVLTDVSVELWVTWTGWRAWERFFDFGTGPTVNWFMTPNASQTGNPRVATTTSGNPGEQRTDATEPFPGGARTHVVYTLDGDGAADQAKLYINGTLVAVHHEDSPLDPAELDWIYNLWLGRSQYAIDPYFAGEIDEFVIHSTVLTDLEVLELYRAIFSDGFESGDTTAWSAVVPKRGAAQCPSS